jgi:excinuclease ABC subunit B
VAGTPIPKDELARLIKELESQMKAAAKNMEFEKAALLRDQVVELRRQLADGEPLALVTPTRREGPAPRATDGDRRPARATGSGRGAFGRRRRGP